MTLTLAGIAFDHHRYDEDGDVLYLHVGAPVEPASALETPEGHHVEYDDLGNVVGLVLLNVRHTLDREGELSLTWPPAHLAAGALEPALAAA